MPAGDASARWVIRTRQTRLGPGSTAAMCAEYIQWGGGGGSNPPVAVGGRNFFLFGVPGDVIF